MIQIIQEQGKTAYGINNYAIDTDNELSQIPSYVKSGSTVYSIENGKTFIKNNQGEWIVWNNNNNNNINQEMVQQIIKNELTSILIPENAEESLNTIEEISAWIQAYPERAQMLNQSIDQLQQSVNNISSLSNDEIDNAIKDI